MEPSDFRILLVDDEEGIRFTLGCLLKKEGFQVDVAASRREAVGLFVTGPYDLAFVDIMLGEESGVKLLRDIKNMSPATQVVMITGRPEVKSAAEAVRLGAFDYLTKPVRHETLMAVSRHALSAKKMNDEREQYRANLDAIFRTVSDSIIMIDREGRLAQFNAAAGAVCGLTRDQIGKELTSVELLCNGMCGTTLLETLQNNAPREMRRFECRNHEGKTRVACFTSTPVVEADGSVGGAVAVIRDETRLADLERSLNKRGRFHNIIGSSAPMQRVFALIETLADVPTTVLINGESGTGKELVAAALHATGSRSGGPFVKVNCSALSESLLESELFGHVRGAFTGAITDKIGRFEKAHGGTLFLDEIGDISPGVQMRLLRVLQESEFERVGDSTPLKVDVRIVAATNQDLAEKVSQGSFRQDLFYRLNVVRMVLPSLRERRDDLEPLVAHFISKFNVKFGRDITGVSTDVMDVFRTHDWPGNVRELEHAIEHAVILCKSDIVSVSDLPHDLLDSLNTGSEVDSTVSDSGATPRSDLTLEEALAISGGNKTRAASLLGISRRTVYRHLEESEPK
ncbi:MAG: sigma-54-dependent Fis family transcriptional regulator [Desulfuromonadales bacterium]|nr:sigma-54-dependent Fis family transcriptional regulator [Desulfuromonadales bacterium]